MKTIKWIILFFVLSLSCASPVLAENEIKITIGKWLPFMGKNLPYYGIVPHIISEIFKQGGVKVKYGFYPWNRSKKYVALGKWHATAIWGKTEEREKLYDFSDVVYKGETVLFYHKDHPINWTGNLEELKDLKIGIKLGSAPSVFIKEAEKKGFVKLDIGGKNTIATLEKILMKRVNAADEIKAVGLHIIQTHFLPEQRELIRYTDTIEIWNYYLMFSKKLEENERFLAIFNQGLQEIKKSGRYDAMWQDFYEGKYNP